MNRRPVNEMKKYFEIIFSFLKVGLFAFGGGYAMIPLVEREIIKKRAWVTMDEVMEFYTVSQIMPGLLGVNLSIFVGNKLKGIFGAFLAAIGFILPGATLITAAAIFISNLADIPAVQHAFAGIRIAVGALILDTVIKLVKGTFSKIKTTLIFLFVFIFSVIPGGIVPSFMTSPVFLVLVSGMTAIIIYRQKKPKPPETPESDAGTRQGRGSPPESGS